MPGFGREDLGAPPITAPGGIPAWNDVEGLKNYYANVYPRAASVVDAMQPRGTESTSPMYSGSLAIPGADPNDPQYRYTVRGYDQGAPFGGYGLPNGSNGQAAGWSSPWNTTNPVPALPTPGTTPAAAGPAPVSSPAQVLPPNFVAPQQPPPAAAPGPVPPPANGFAPGGTGSTLPNLFGQGGTGTNSGTNIFGGGGNIFSPGGVASPSFTPGNAPNFIAPPPPQQLTTNPPPTGVSPSSALAQFGASGLPTNATPTWQAMIDAQQRRIQENAANLAEQFNVSGNRFSTAFGTGMSDYFQQTSLDQNALLAQLTQQAQEAARGRQMSALGQLSGQDFQSMMQQAQLQYGAGLNMLNTGYGAASQLNQMSGTAAMGLNQLASGAAQGLFGTENQAALAEVARQLQLQQLQTGQAGTLSQLWQSNLGLGNQIGSTDYMQQQSAINNAYQEWMRTQPQNNPYINMMYSAATNYPNLFFPQQTPPQLGNLMAGAGGLMTGIAALMMA